MNYQYTTWTPDLSVGDIVIDHQHKQLIATVNSLFDAYKSGKGHREIERTMDSLVKYTDEHFTDEEKLQEQYAYPGRVAHKAVHAEFKKTVDRLVGRFRREGPTESLIDHVCITIGRWTLNHIKNEDLKMITYILNKKRAMSASQSAGGRLTTKEQGLDIHPEQKITLARWSINRS